MAKMLKRAANVSLVVNIFLFIIKAVAGVISNSIAVISDAINSLTDIVSSAAIMYSVQVSLKHPDTDHQFGHRAAQPIAVFIIALFAGIVGLKVIEESISRIINPNDIHAYPSVYIILVITIIVKLLLTRYQRKIGNEYKSPGLRASAVDSLNDVLATSLSLVGIICSELGIYYVDGVAGILIALIIFKSGYEIARENIDYLMGKSAGDDLVLEIANAALRIKGVEGINELRSHYVGDKFHIEIHIDIKKEITTQVSHDIGVLVNKEICKLAEVSKVFVHIDPV